MTSTTAVVRSMMAVVRFEGDDGNNDDETCSKDDDDDVICGERMVDEGSPGWTNGVGFEGDGGGD